MARTTYIPDRGDLAHVNLSPSAGKEMTGPHYCLILSSKRYNQEYGMAICVPIMSTIRNGPYEVLVPKGILPAKAGFGEVDSVIRADSIRQFDFRERSMSFIAKCPPQILDEATLIGLSMIDPQAEF